MVLALSVHVFSSSRLVAKPRLLSVLLDSGPLGLGTKSNLRLFFRPAPYFLLVVAVYFLSDLIFFLAGRRT